MLIHTIHETIQFDQGLKDAYPLSPAIQQWLGLTHVFCEDTDVFALWLKQELKSEAGLLRFTMNV